MNAFWVITFCVSTSGAAPVTVMDSSTEPTRSSAFTVAVKPVVSSIPSRRKVPNPGRVNVTGIRAGPELHDAVQALRVRDDGARLFDKSRARRFDGDTGKHAASRIAHDTSDGAAEG